MLQYIIVIVILGFIYESTSWFFRIHQSIVWVKKHRLISGCPPVLHKNQNVYVLIPVLLETEILSSTVEYFNNNFLKGDSSIFLIIITTERERALDKSSHNTIDLATSLVGRYKNVTHIHFPEIRGKMAHQLNYAIRKLNETASIKNTDLIAIYNADSRPERETFTWVIEKLSKRESSAFQQYGYYSENILQLNNSSWSSILISGSLWQTRWSLGFEIYNALKQLKFSNSRSTLKLNYPLNYCIGHGLFITKDLLDRIGGFNEESHNEDAILGLQLSEMQELLMPVPYFDISESPDTVNMLYKQKSNWYFGPLQSYSYMADILRKKKFGKFGKLRLFFLSTKLFFHAIFWIVGPTMIFFSLAFSLIYQEVSLLFLCLLSLSLFAFPSLSSYLEILKLKIPSPGLGLRITSTKLAKGFMFFYFLHGASAYRGLFKFLIQTLSNKEAVKEKTIITRF